MGRSTGLGVVNQLGCLQEFLGVCMHLDILMITQIRVHNSIFIGEVFQIEVSHGPVHWRGSYKNLNLYPARVFAPGEFLGV